MMDMNYSPPPFVTPNLEFPMEGGSNYDSWRQKMLAALAHEGLTAFIDGKSNPPPKMIPGADASRFPAVNQEYIRWKKMDSWVKAFILSFVEKDSGYGLVWMRHTDHAILTARDAWMTLQYIDLYMKQLPSEMPSPGNEADRAFDKDCFAMKKALSQNDMKALETLFHRYKGRVDEGWLKLMALYLATGTGNSLLHVVEQLKEPGFMPDHRILQCPSDDGQTLLTIAAAVGNLAAAKILVDTCPILPFITNSYGEFPVLVAAIHSHRRTLEYLMSVSTDNPVGHNLDGPFAAVSHGLDLLLAVIDAEYFDIGIRLVTEYPNLATEKNKEGTSPLKLLATKETVFQPLLPFKFLEPFVFLMTPRVRRKHKMARDALELVRTLCEKMENAPESELELWKSAVFAAVNEGNYLVAKEIVDTFPDVVWSVSPDNEENIFHVAVKQRSIEIFKLLTHMGDYTSYILRKPDKDGNNVLHLAGKLAAADRLNLISGSALQMQYEIQWYKALEELVPDYCKERVNNEGYSPMALFRKEHRQLKQEAEKWMRDTAQSCSIAAALIATVMFTAAIQVPGGSDPKLNHGFPVFSGNPAFTVFAIADVISLFSSTTSVLSFLSLLTSRYREEDFFNSLPRRLIIGLLSLFLSISFLMVSFAATIFIVLGRMKIWVITPVAIMAFVPIVAFVWMHFRVLMDWVSSTCNLGLLGRKECRHCRSGISSACFNYNHLES